MQFHQIPNTTSLDYRKTHLTLEIRLASLWYVQKALITAGFKTVPTDML